MKAVSGAGSKGATGIPCDGSLSAEWPGVARFQFVRRRTLALCQPLTAEDMMVQSCPEASPVKWHLAHTAWFFESFVLKEFLPRYELFNPEFPWLFNSYYRSFSAFPEKRLRASFSRPGLEEVLRYREYVDQGIERLLSMNPEPEVLRRIELGVNHEEQHQELLLTDILHAFFTNPLRPAYRDSNLAPDLGAPGLDSETWEGTNSDGIAGGGKTRALCFHEFAGGMREIGYGGEGFCYDNELPRHRVWLEPFTLANRLVNCGEFAAFIADGGYQRPELWLSAGWDAVERNSWQAPLYWSPAGKSWSIFTLRGELPLAALEAAPVSQVSFYEADAYARWAGARLATEFEWEAAAGEIPMAGNLLDSGRLMPGVAPSSEKAVKDALSCMKSGYEKSGLVGQGFSPDKNAVQPARALAPEVCPAQQIGDCWEWTASAYLGYPGYKPAAGSLGEYNGKFMSGQMVLRGGSCATPQAHIRASYRNFFAPETRWQFSGIRLAK
jgi:ergothioneine biosynthesis protein EgtB